MFRESLLESSRSGKQKRWPMAAAFAGEIIIAGLLVLIPLLTTAVIRVSAHVAPIASLRAVRVANGNPTNSDSGPRAITRSDAVVTLGNANQLSFIGRSTNPLEDCCGDPPTITDPNGPNMPSGDHVIARVKPAGPDHVRVSSLSEAQLLNKVEPTYPRMALLTHRQGDVKLHAFISKDGAIESLSVISGDPLLIPATLEAVRQWRYRPYLLNGEPVEVETFITVSFKGIRD